MAAQSTGDMVAPPSGTALAGTAVAGTTLAGALSSTRKLSRIPIAITVFLGGFVISEPAPYEAMLILTFVTFLTFGMRLSRMALYLAIIFMAFNIGGLVSMFQMADYGDIPLYLAVSFYLGLSAVFFCAIIESDMGRLRVIFRAYVLGAIATAVLGILGYFEAFPGAEIFTLYGRAMGSFKDPNVFSPFLVLPTIYLFYGLLQRPFTFAPFRAAALLILLTAQFLAFSRAGWGLTIIAGLLFYFLLFASEQNAAKRMKMTMVMGGGLLAMLIVLLIALQFEAVGEMFDIRTKAVQDYDSGVLGRFARHAIGFQWALEKPFGIGPLEFGLKLGADTHNIWLKSLMDYGWLGFASWLSMSVWTIFGPMRILLKNRPWTPYLQVAWATFVGHIIIAYVIDIDHWRHVYLIVGVIWGCMALEVRYQVQLAKNSPVPSV